LSKIDSNFAPTLHVAGSVGLGFVFSVELQGVDEDGASSTQYWVPYFVRELFCVTDDDALSRALAEHGHALEQSLFFDRC
jgi:hypothetical protein